MFLHFIDKIKCSLIVRFVMNFWYNFTINNFAISINNEDTTS